MHPPAATTSGVGFRLPLVRRVPNYSRLRVEPQYSLVVSAAMKARMEKLAIRVR